MLVVRTICALTEKFFRASSYDELIKNAEGIIITNEREYGMTIDESLQKLRDRFGTRHLGSLSIYSLGEIIRILILFTAIHPNLVTNAH